MTKMKFLYYLYILEVILILPMLGDNKNVVLSSQIIHNIIITIIFGFNCIVNLCFWAFKSNKQRIDYIVIALLFSVILFVPINNIIIAIK